MDEWRPCATMALLAVVEELLKDETESEFVVTVLENLQNLLSHGLGTFWSADEVRLLLGPEARSAGRP